MSQNLTDIACESGCWQLPEVVMMIWIILGIVLVVFLAIWLFIILKGRRKKKERYDIFVETFCHEDEKTNKEK